MKICTDKQSLLKMIFRAQNIVVRKETMPILINVLLEAKNNKLELKATNLEVSLIDKMDVEVIEEGTIAISAKSLFDIIKELNEGDLVLESTENNWMKITQNKTELNLVGANPLEFPVFPAFQSKEFITLDAKVLLEMIDKTIFSISNDGTRYHLNGVYFENVMDKDDQQKYVMVATDGHRLSIIERKIDITEVALFKKGVIIPKKGLIEVKKLIETVDDIVETAIEGAQFVVKSNDTLLMIRLIEGRYPNYKQLIPKKMDKRLQIEKIKLIACLKRVSLLSNEKSKGVIIRLKNNKMEISSNNPKLGDAKDEIDIDYKGEDLTISFNAKYILEILAKMDEDTINFDFKNTNAPGVLSPKGDKNYNCVVMPMRMT